MSRVTRTGGASRIDLQILRPDMPFLLPEAATAGASGMDLRAALDRKVLLRPGQRRRIPTGIAVAIPEGFEGQVRPRSGLAVRHGISVLNSPGTIDSDYRGEIQVVLINLGEDPYWVEPGDRVAQLVLHCYVRVAWNVVETLDETDRGQAGFGHSGR